MVEIEKFIKENGLSFTGTGSQLNGNCVIICGYALHLKINIFDFLVTSFTTTKLSPTAEQELERVYDYAYKNGYEKYWKTEDAKLNYKF